MNDFIECIRQEIDELGSRIDELKLFIDSSTFDECVFIYRDLCYRQLNSMREYYSLLCLRHDLLTSESCCREFKNV